MVALSWRGAGQAHGGKAHQALLALTEQQPLGKHVGLSPCGAPRQD